MLRIGADCPQQVVAWPHTRQLPVNMFNPRPAGHSHRTTVLAENLIKPLALELAHLSTAKAKQEAGAQARAALKY
jgi:hypothetical protein